MLHKHSKGVKLVVFGKLFWPERIEIEMWLGSPGVKRLCHILYGLVRENAAEIHVNARVQGQSIESYHTNMLNPTSNTLQVKYLNHISTILASEAWKLYDVWTILTCLLKQDMLQLGVYFEFDFWRLLTAMDRVQWNPSVIMLYIRVI